MPAVFEGTRRNGKLRYTMNRRLASDELGLSWDRCDSSQSRRSLSMTDLVV
jgi:hypothetical protein